MGKLGSKSLLGLSQSKGGNGGTGFKPGPNQGLGSGQRDPGRAEGTNFDRKEKIHPNELNPGDIVGTLPDEGEAPRGEAALPVRVESSAALQRMAEKVDSEVLPAEYREQIRLYMESLRKAGAGDK